MFVDPPPELDDVVQPSQDAKGRRLWRMTRTWINYIRDNLVAALNLAPRAIGSIALANQGAAILTTPLPIPALTTGQYVVLYTLRCSRPDGVSSAFKLTLSWLDNGVTLTKTSANVNGNTTASFDQGVIYLTPDSPGPINYAVSWTSGGGGPNGLFDLDIVVLELRVPVSA